MRRLLCVLTIGVICGLGLVRAQGAPSAAEDKAIGSWTGTFSGDATGKYTMAITRGADKKLGGTLDTMPDSGDGYSSTFSSVKVDGARLTMAYVPPGAGDGTEAQLEATLDGTSLKGTWKIVDTQSKSVAQSGEFIGTKR
jgi:hypothetical protein